MKLVLLIIALAAALEDIPEVFYLGSDNTVSLRAGMESVKCLGDEYPASIYKWNFGDISDPILRIFNVEIPDLGYKEVKDNTNYLIRTSYQCFGFYVDPDTKPGTTMKVEFNLKKSHIFTFNGGNQSSKASRSVTVKVI